MKCWNCGEELRWESDSDWEDTEGNQCTVSYFSCDSCKAFVEFYLPYQDEDNG